MDNNQIKDKQLFLAYIQPYTKLYWMVEEGYETKEQMAEDIISNMPPSFDRDMFISFLSEYFLVPEHILSTQ